MAGAPRLAVRAEFLGEQRELQDSLLLAVCAELVQLLLDAVSYLAAESLRSTVRIDSKTSTWKSNDET